MVKQAVRHGGFFGSFDYQFYFFFSLDLNINQLNDRSLYILLFHFFMKVGGEKGRS